MKTLLTDLSILKNRLTGDKMGIQTAYVFKAWIEEGDPQYAIGEVAMTFYPLWIRKIIPY